MLVISGESQKVPRALIITGNGNVPSYRDGYPPWIHEFQNEMVADILKDVVTVDVTSDLNFLAAGRLEQYDLVISNSLFLEPSNEQLDALYRFVSNGKSYLTLHCGILSLLNWNRYEEFIGGIFIGGPASVPEEFRVSTTNTEFWGYEYSFRAQEDHPVSMVVDDFVTRDELYHFQPSARNFHVIARAENLPVMWWHPVGKGKVMSLTLGHDEEAKGNHGYQSLLRHGVQWLTGYPLIYSNYPRVVSTRNMTYENFLALGAATHSEDSSVSFEVRDNFNPDIISIESTAQGMLTLKLSGNPGSGKFIIAANASDGLSTTRAYDLRIVKDGTGDLASYHGNTVMASSYENNSSVFQASNMLDDDPSTRWSSAPRDSAWVVIDLQKVYEVRRVVLHWEASFASAYQIQSSQDGKFWNTIVAVTDGDGETDTLNFKPVRTRYIRIHATSRAHGKWGYSLYEVDVYKE